MSICFRLRLLSTLVLGLIFFGVGRVGAQSIWDGGGTDDNWTTGANWLGDVAPVSGSTLQLQFAGSTRTTPTTQVPFSLSTITFNSGASAFTVGGAGQLTVFTGITNADDSTQTINNGIVFGSNVAMATTSTGNLTLGGLIDNGGFTLTATPAAATTITVGGISGSGGVTKNGAGTLKFNGAGNFSGATTVNAGTIAVNDPLGLGTSTVTYTANSTFQFSSALSAPVANNMVINNTVTLTVDVNDVNNTMTGVLSGAGGVTYFSSPSATASILQVQGVNTYTGGTTIGNGVAANLARVVIGADSGLGASAGNLTINVGQLMATNSFSMTRSVAINSSATLIAEDSTVLSVNGVVSGVSPLNIGSSTVTAGVTNFHTGKINLGGANTFTGNVVIRAGTLGITSDGNLGNVANDLFFNSSSSGAVNSTTTLNIGETLTLGAGRSIDISNTAGDTAVFDVDSGKTGTINGVISGTASGTLQKSGTGTLVLAGANTYTGSTTISAGTVQLSGAGTLGNATAVTVASGATLDMNGVALTAGSIAGAGNIGNGGALLTTGGNNTSTTFSGVMSGAGAFTKNGTGTQTLSGANTFTGLTTINAGAINIQNATALGTTAAGTTVVAGSALQIQGGISVGAEALTLNGTGVATDGALRSISGNNTFGGPITLGSASRINSDAGTLTLNNTIGGAFGLTVGGAGDTAISGVIGTGANTVTKDGAGMLTLSGLNTYSGGTVINNGTVSINTIANTGVASALGTGAVTVGSAGNQGILSYTGVTATSDRGLTVGGAGGGRLNTTTAGQTLTLTGAIANGGNLFSVGGAGNTTLNGVISGGGGLTFDGSGTLVLGGANTYTGATTLSSGTTQLGGGGATLGNNSAVTVASGAVFDLNGNATAIGSLAGAGSVTNGGGLLTTGGDGTSTTFSGIISGAGGLTKNGAGTQTLSGGNTYDGTTTINAGVINIQNATGLGSTVGGTTVVAGSALQLQGVSVGAEALTLNGTGVANDGALRSVSGSNTFGGPITLGSASRINSDAGTLTLNNTIGGAFGLTVGGAGDTAISGVIGTGANSLTYDGTGTLTLTGVNTYSGGTVVSSGTLSFDSIADTGTASALGTGTITVGSAGSAGTLSYTGGTASSNRALSVGGAGGGRLNVTSSGSNLTISGGVNNGGNAFAVGGSGNTTLTGALVGGGSLTKDGSGTLTLGAAAHTYSGATTISAGEIAIATGATANSSAFTINPGATLSGFGSVQSIVNNGTANVGDSTTIGTLTTTGAYSGTGTARLKFAGTGGGQFDVLAIGGVGTLTGGTLKPTLSGGFVPAVGSTITGVVTATGGFGGTQFATVSHPAPVLAATPTYNANSIDLTFSRDLTNPDLGLDSAQTGLAQSLASLDNGTNADITAVLDALTQITTEQGVRDAYDEILPRKLDQLSAASMTGARLQNGNLVTRMNNLRFGVTPRSFGFVDNDGAAKWNYDGLLVAQNGRPFDVLRNVERLGIDNDEHPWGFFVNGSGLYGDQDARANQTAYDFFTVGATVGADYRLTDELIAGLSAGYNHTKTTVDNNGGDARVNAVSIAPYASYTTENIYFDATAGYARNFYDIDRNIVVGTINRTATGDTEGNQVFGYLGAGYDHRIRDFVTGPVATMQYTRLWVDSYTETGAGALNLTISDQSADSLQSGIGWHWAYYFRSEGVNFIPNLTATYQHEFMNSSRLIEASLAGGSSFQTPTATPSRDFAEVNLGMNTQLEDWIILTLGYHTLLGADSYIEHGVNGGVRLEF